MTSHNTMMTPSYYSRTMENSRMDPYGRGQLDYNRGYNRSNPRSDPMARHSHTHPAARSPTHQSSAQNGTSGGAPRRRIPVACARCRKRKIRCSGDPGDNSGCLNCKGASVQPGQCQFLRVASSTIEMAPLQSSSSPAVNHVNATGLPPSSMGSLSGGHTSAPMLSMQNGFTSIDHNRVYRPEPVTTTYDSAPSYIASEMPQTSTSYAHHYLPSTPHAGNYDSSDSTLRSQNSEYRQQQQWDMTPKTMPVPGSSPYSYSDANSSQLGYNSTPVRSSSYSDSTPSSSLETSNYTNFPALGSLTNNLPKGEGGSRSLPEGNLFNNLTLPFPSTLPPPTVTSREYNFNANKLSYNNVSYASIEPLTSSAPQSRPSSAHHRSPVASSYGSSSPAMHASNQRSSSVSVSPSCGGNSSPNSYTTAASTTTANYIASTTATTSAAFPSATTMYPSLPSSGEYIKRSPSSHEQSDYSLTGLQQYQSTPRSTAHISTQPPTLRSVSKPLLA